MNLSNNENYIAVGDIFGNLYLNIIRDKQIQLLKYFKSIHLKQITAIAFNNSDTQIAVGSYDRELKMIDICEKDPKRMVSFELKDYLNTGH